MAKSWWFNAYLGCNQAQLGQYAEALDSSSSQLAARRGWVWSPLLQDSPCFRKKEIATHPRYIALIEHLEARKKALCATACLRRCSHTKSPMFDLRRMKRVRPERNDRFHDLYEAALKKPIGERPSFVARQAGDDQELRRQVEALLSGQEETEHPGYEPATGALLQTGTLIGSYRIDGPLARWDGRGVPGDGHQAPPSGGDQGAAGDLGGSGSATALSARSAVGVLVQPPAHRDGVRRGGVSRAAVPDHGVRGRGDATAVGVRDRGAGGRSSSC